jgi:Structure-specific recognition protein (SSRP1)
VQEQALSTVGRNWGNLSVNGSSLMFLVADKLGFEVPLRDVSQVVESKDDVSLEFAVDDTEGGDADTLAQMVFHVPQTNEEFTGEGEGKPAAVRGQPRFYGR